LRKGIERNPEFPMLYGDMAMQVWKLGRLGETAKWIDAALKLSPSSVMFQSGQCRALLELGDDQSAEHCLDKVQAADPERRDKNRVELYLFRSQPEEVARLLDQLVQSDLPPHWKPFLPIYYTNAGDVDKGRPIFRELEPALFSDQDVIIKPDDLLLVTLAAYTLYVGGQLDRANYLFDQALATMESMHRTRGVGYSILDVLIHSIRGDKQKAISALRDAIDTGWRHDWWRLRMSYFDSVRQEPEWISLVTELEADIARQRQWYENHKDEPLF
jgi:tetratricopeptide (TPR) repeat protein